MSRWDHALCDACWDAIDPERSPYRLVEDIRTDERCCRCGATTRSGIYRRADPAGDEVACGGDHGG